MEQLFIHPAPILVCGPTSCGKTHTVAKFLKDGMIYPFPDRVIWTYSEWQPAYSDLVNYGVEFIKGTPPGLVQSLSPLDNNVIVLDDQMAEFGSDKELGNMFTKGSHHRNITVIYIVQNMFDKGKYMRPASLNSHYLVCFKSPRDKTQIATLARQMFPKASKFLIESFEDATREPHSYLLLDWKPETPEIFRVRGSGDDVYIPL